MKFQIGPEIIQKYPGIRIGVLIADLSETDQIDAIAIENYVQEEERASYEALAGIGIDNVPEIMEWRQIYQSFGCSQKKISSVESLARKLLADRKIFRINPLVNLYNAVSLKYLVPMAGYDLEKIDGSLQLAIVNDKSLSFRPLGLNQQEYPKFGEVIYKDSEKVICRCWNNKDCDQTKITSDNKKLLFIIDGAERTSKTVDLALAELAANLEAFVHCKNIFAVAAAAEPLLELS